MTERAAVMVSEQPKLPVQALPQNENDWPVTGTAVKVTTVFLAKLRLHAGPVPRPLVIVQLIPVGDEVTTPLPLPVPVTVRRNWEVVAAPTLLP